MLANVCGDWYVQSQVLPNIRGGSRTQVVTELTDDNYDQSSVKDIIKGTPLQSGHVTQFFF